MNALEYMTGGLKAADIGEKVGAKATFVVKDVSDRKFDGDPAPKLQLHFDGIGKLLILNKTNLETMIAQFGGDTGKWPGAKVTLTVVETHYSGKKVHGIQLKAA